MVNGTTEYRHIKQSSYFSTVPNPEIREAAETAYEVLGKLLGRVA
jgi:hypothetical protein